MVDDQIIPRLLAKAGSATTIFLKRFHSFGLGESRVDAMLEGVESLAPAGEVKLGFRAHYPQLETKLLVRGKDMADVRSKLAPVEAEVRKRMGNFIMTEDEQTLERLLLELLTKRNATLAIAETFTGGNIAARLVPLPGAERVIRRGVVALDRSEFAAAYGLQAVTAESVASGARAASGATYGLAVFVDLDEGADRIDFGGVITIGIATAESVVTRRSRLVGGRDWLRLGTMEMALDSLRRHLLGLPVDERIDFEKV